MECYHQYEETGEIGKNKCPNYPKGISERIFYRAGKCRYFEVAKVKYIEELRKQLLDVE
jgi:hypothetical protein